MLCPQWCLLSQLGTRTLLLGKSLDVLKRDARLLAAHSAEKAKVRGRHMQLSKVIAERARKLAHARLALR